MLARHNVKRPRSGPLLRGRERVVVNLRRKQAHHHVFPLKRLLAGPRRPGDVKPGRPAAAAGRPGIHPERCRVCGPRHRPGRREPACPSAAQGTWFPWMRRKWLALAAGAVSP